MSNASATYRAWWTMRSATVRTVSDARRFGAGLALSSPVSALVNPLPFLLLHWKGGDHSHLVVPRNRTGEHRWTTDAQTGALIRDLARMLPDELIAGLLNRLGKKTGKGNSWTKTKKSNSVNVHLSPSICDSVHFHRPFKRLRHV